MVCTHVQSIHELSPYCIQPVIPYNEEVKAAIYLAKQLFENDFIFALNMCCYKSVHFRGIHCNTLVTVLFYVYTVIQLY
jgi:hypothetical protein